MNKNIFKQILSSVAFSLLVNFGINAQESVSASYPYAMAFSGVVRNPVCAASGFAGAASSSGMAWSSFGNPAAMSFYKGKFDAQLSYGNWQPAYGKSTDIAAGVAYRSNGGFGISGGFLYQGGQPYDMTDASGAVIGSFKPDAKQFGLGLGFKVADFMSIGLNVKGLSQKLGSSGSSFAVGGDIFAMASFSYIKITAGVANVGTPVKSASGQSYHLPASIKLGGAYSLVFAEKHGIEAMVDADYYFLAGGFAAAAGVQYGFNDMIFVRGGYHYGTSKALLPSFASVGLGAKIFGVRLDVAYLLGNDVLKNSLSVGLGYTF